MVQSKVAEDDDGIEIMVDIEDDDADLAINLDSEELVVQSTVDGISSEELIVEENEISLAETLENKAESDKETVD